ncbi:uncharacterized protein BO95DRAFT_241954 [Aspergillus brunneoviolaceus CBS 621.78]|uniref:Uncharacterized protein n=1 Tax=Aspergillus brunneoviolaceus CBS 621.78 TaxID=1450534 RepID=A0ACD1FYR5_9EURO|nr:hypothetical protein BO95DRAFT_241954 [Aspergillus brunneoviolaceus CBS 621.78]RAH42109.1 hypothetical protein BO95DRAFT_241954 [Aspergillus brunneoviolaceus CBS 621.78]
MIRTIGLQGAKESQTNRSFAFPARAESIILLLLLLLLLGKDGLRSIWGAPPSSSGTARTDLTITRKGKKAIEHPSSEAQVASWTHSFVSVRSAWR